MDDDTPSWFYSTPLATLLLCGAVAIFLLGYLPEAKEARKWEAKVEEVQLRISELSRQEQLANHRIAELEAGVSVAIEEAAREVLRLGGTNDFLPADNPY